jgi:Rrf2 family protein
MRLTKQTGYAIRILLHCALAGDRYVKVTEIAHRNQITEHNIFKIVPILVQSGFIEALRGRNGGIRLARAAEDIHIGDVVRATEATHVEADCFGAAGDCAIRPVAPINRILDHALDAFINVLDKHTLAELARARPRAGEGTGDDDLAAHLAGHAGAKSASSRLTTG